MQIEPMAVIVIFYLYLLARWQYVKRPFFYLIGAAGILFAMAGDFFGLGQATIKVRMIFQIIGQLVAFVGVVAACFGAKLPGVEVPLEGYKQQEQ
ncbi:MAG TPA: hypothetical protein PKG77_17555 [Phycisphaerae bacterium]|nr:hypothetical protein [Phycisphaerae bacterium]HQL71897.1 hypothetical protein [Phycisphaerae bacterium]